MSYREYQAMISGKEIPALPDGWEAKDFKFNDPIHGEWYGTAYIRQNIPQFMDFYQWKASDQQINSAMESMFPAFKLVEISGGNGHYRAYFEEKS